MSEIFMQALRETLDFAEETRERVRERVKEGKKRSLVKEDNGDRRKPKAPPPPGVKKK